MYAIENHMLENVSYAPWNEPEYENEPKKVRCDYCGYEYHEAEMNKMKDGKRTLHICIDCLNLRK